MSNSLGIGGTRLSSSLSGVGALSGLGNVLSSEAIPYSLPRNQNSPHKVPYGLYAEQLSGSAFTVPRKQNKWLWTYRIRPSVCHTPSNVIPMKAHPYILPPLLYLPHSDPKSKPDANNYAVHNKYCGWVSPPYENAGDFSSVREPATPPIALRWKPLPNVLSGNTVDFIEGMITLASFGDPACSSGGATLLYSFNASMSDVSLKLSLYGRPGSSKGRYVCNSDGEMLFVPYQGSIKLKTEAGIMVVPPGHIAFVPRGMKFQVDCEKDNTQCKGYICENYGSPFVLPELGLIGSSTGLANARHFISPSASFEELSNGPYELITKFQGRIWSGLIEHSPLDIVAWYGTYLPYQYDLSLFNCINSVSFDHPDPSIYTVLTSPGGNGSVGAGVPGVANIDFVLFPPRWICMENTFRPPWFHRNYMSELMGNIKGEYDAKQSGGFVPGAVSIHNRMIPHGPDYTAWNKATNDQDASIPIRNSNDNLAFMLECSGIWNPTLIGSKFPQPVKDMIDASYSDCWQGIKKNFNANSSETAKQLAESPPLTAAPRAK